MTVPIGMNPVTAPTAAVSYADDPASSDPLHAALVAASNTLVVIVVVALTTLKGSHELVDPA